MNTPSDTELTQLLQDDPRAAVDWVATHYQTVIKMAVATFRLNPEDKADVMQEIWVMLCYNDYARLRAWDPARARFQTYLNLLVRCTTLNWLRTRNRITRALMPAGPINEPGEDYAQYADQTPDDQRNTILCRELLENLESMIHQLVQQKCITPEDQVLVRAMIEGKKPRDIAELLGRPENWVYLRKHRLRKILAKAVDGF